MIVIFVALLVYSFLFGGCSIDHEYAQKKVEKYLMEQGLPISPLLYEGRNDRTCGQSFMYEGSGEKIHFVVIDDFTRGPKLTMWDYNEQE
jgi:hypothetical protein